MAGHTHHGSRLRALSPQVEACSGCMHCSGKPSNRTKLSDTMGNRRHFPTPGLPNPVATPLVKVHSKRSKSVLLSAQPVQSVQCSHHPQPPSTSPSPITSTPLSVFMFSVNFDHQEHLRQRLSQASRSIKRMLTPPRQGSGDQGESSVHRRQHVSHHDSEVQGNQESEAGIIESVQENSDSVAHDQQRLPPPQNQESMSQWRSWVRS